MSQAKHTPGPWFEHREGFATVYIEARIGGGMLQEVAACGPTDAGQDQQSANARLIAMAPDLLAYVKRKAENAEQREFEDWLQKNRPSGDVTEVQRQWKEGSEYSDFCDEWSVELDLISKATGAA